VEVTVSQKGWVVIPAELREKYRWKTGDRVRVVDYGGVISLVPVLQAPETEGFGALRHKRSLTTALRRARKTDRAREGRR
jgi:AbrB family looped-hinge helix DNA binding protein